MSYTSLITKKRLINIGLAIVVLTGINWLYTHAYVAVVVDKPPVGAAFSYEFINQKTNKTTKVSSSASSIKKLLPTGKYLVVIRSVTAPTSTKQSLPAKGPDSKGATIERTVTGNSSFVSLAKTGRFMGTSRLSGRLNSESLRSFIGDNPQSCFDYLSGVLATYTCEDLVKNIKLQVPASSRQPSYQVINSNTDLPYVRIVGTAQTSEGLLALTRPPTTGLGLARYSIYRVTDSYGLTKGQEQLDLDAGKSYKIKNFDSSSPSFIVYEQGSFGSVLAYDASNLTPKKIILEGPKQKGLAATSIDYRQPSLAAAFTSAGDSRKATTEIVVSQQGKNSHTVVDERISTIAFCGNSKLCAIGDLGFSVYDVTKDGAVVSKPVYRIRGASTMVRTLKGVSIVRGSDIYQLDVDKKTGYVSYSLGNYRLASIKAAPGGFVAVVSGADGRKVALSIDVSQPDVNNIDKQVYELSKLKEISTVSAFSNHIFVSPKVSSTYFDSAAKSYTYGPGEVIRANAVIDAKIAELKIDTKYYTIYNPLKQN